MPAALLISENPQDASHLARHLRKLECECEFAASYQEALALLRTQSFALVLSPVWVRGVSVFPLIDLLEGSVITLFYSQRVEDSYWWLPALQRGVRCFGSSALRPHEFTSVLDQILAQIQSNSRSLHQRAQQSVSSSLEDEAVPAGPIHAKLPASPNEKRWKKAAG